MTQKDRSLALRSIFDVPFFADENPWLPEVSSQTGLSVYEDNRGHVVVEAELPGLKPEDIEVTFEKGILWIRGEKKIEESDKEKRYYRKTSSSFSYRAQVPGLINEKKEPEATYKNGVMTVTFERLQEAQKRRIPVTVK